MAIPQQMLGNHVVLSPQVPLTIGGRAEEFEQRVQALLKEGHRHVVTDFGKVTFIDSTGVRALVRGYTTARRLGGSFKLVKPNARIQRLLRITRLDGVFEIYDSVEAAQAAGAPGAT